jgi:Fibronectin type III domain.
MKKSVKKIISIVLVFVFLAGNNADLYAKDIQEGGKVITIPASQYYYDFESGLGDAVVVTNKAETSGEAQVPMQDLTVSAKYVDGKNGRALALDGSYGLKLPVRNLGESYTVSFWVKVDTEMTNFTSILFAGRDYIVDEDNDNLRWLAITQRDDMTEFGGAPLIWSRHGTNDVFPWYCYQAGEAWIYNNVIKPINGWKHIILTVDGTKTAIFGAKEPDDIGDDDFVPYYYEGSAATTYVDGQFFGTGCVATGVYDNINTETYLGIDPWDNKFKGYIDEVAFYSQSVTALEAKKIYEHSSNGDGQGTSVGNENKDQNVAKDPTPVPDSTSGDQTQNKSSDKKDSGGVLQVKTLPKVSSLKLKAKKKAFTAKWKKVKKATKYQIQYANSKKKLGKAKKKTVRKTSVTIKGLKKKKTYYVRVRAYIKKDKKTIYGKWSSIKKIKIKK